MNTRFNRYLRRNRVRLAAITVLAPALGLTLSAAPFATQAAQASPSCFPGFVCTWHDAGYQGTEWDYYFVPFNTWWFVGYDQNDQISSFYNRSGGYFYMAKNCLADSQWTFADPEQKDINLVPNRWPDGSGMNDSISAYAMGKPGLGLSFPAHGSRTAGGC